MTNPIPESLTASQPVPHACFENARCVEPCDGGVTLHVFMQELGKSMCLHLDEGGRSVVAHWADGSFTLIKNLKDLRRWLIEAKQNRRKRS